MGKGPDTEEWKTRIASNAKVWSRPQISRSFFGGFCSSYPAVYGCGSFGRAPPGERSETRFPRATATVKRWQSILGRCVSEDMDVCDIDKRCRARDWPLRIVCRTVRRVCHRAC